MRRRFHKNLHKGQWTMSGTGCPATHLDAVYLRDVACKQPNPANKKVITVRNGGKRSVHCWIWSSDWTTDMPPMPAHAKRVLYNPKRGDKFFHIEGKQVDELSQVWLRADGTCWAVL